MKEVKVAAFSIFFLLAIFSTISAQESVFWANSPVGGLYDAGFIYRLDGNGQNLGIVHHFRGGTQGEQPFWDLTIGPNGRVYGIAFGGNNGRGVIFSISILDGGYRVDYHFEMDGPSGSMVLASNGKLYGFVGSGFGHIFEFDPILGAFSILHSFNRSEGRVVAINNLMIEVEENILLGVTTRGSSIPNEDAGVIFTYDIESSLYEVQYEFDGSAGFYPETIRPYLDGKFYGTTTGRGGTIFEFDYTTGEVSLVFSFPNHFSGLIPGILFASDGNFYGVSGTGGEGHVGTIFRYHRSSGVFTTIKNFYEENEPHIPETSLIQGQNGKIYGNTRYVSMANAGITAFELDPTTDQLEFVTTNASLGGLSIYNMLELGCEQLDPGNCEVLNIPLTSDGAFYPNPTTSGRVFYAPEPKVPNVQYFLFDLAGKLIDQGVMQEAITIAGPKGVYLLSLPHLGICERVVKN